MTIDDYMILADIPKIQLESEEELPGLRWRNQSPSPCREQKLRTDRLVKTRIGMHLMLHVCPVACKAKVHASLSLFNQT